MERKSNILDLEERKDSPTKGGVGFGEVSVIMDEREVLFSDNKKLRKVVKSANLEAIGPILEEAGMDTGSRGEMYELLSGGSEADMNRAKIIIARFMEGLRQKREKKVDPVKSLPSFAPESVKLTADGDLISDLMERETVCFSDFSDRLREPQFPSQTHRGSLEDKLVKFIDTMCEGEITGDEMERFKCDEEINFSVMALPCLNPNPMVTDHPDDNIGVNIPTVIFLKRLNHFAEGISDITGKKTNVRVLSEITAMNKIFTSLSDDQVVEGKERLKFLVEEQKLDRVELHFLEPEFDESATNSETEVNKYFKTFRNSQFDPNIPLPVMMERLGSINQEKRDQLINDLGLSVSGVEERIQRLDEKAKQQATKWSTLRDVSWGEFPLDGIQMSIRPGSLRLKFIPVTNIQTDRMPMLPQHCSVGILSDNTHFASKRIDFLLNPGKWREIVTEHGSVFEERSD